MKKLDSINVLSVLFIFLCCSSFILADVNIDIGEFAITNPKISAHYSKPVFVDLATLTYQGQFPETYVLCVKPSAGFAVDYELTVLQGGGTAGSCTEKFESLQPGPYLLTISARDPNNVPSQANPPDKRSFTLTGLEITLISPAFGVGTSNPVPVTLYTHEFVNNRDTPRSATCKWTGDPNVNFDPLTYEQTFATLQNMATTGGSNHTLNFPGRGTLKILCRESSGRFTSSRIPIDFDTTPPVMSGLTLQPRIVRDPGNKYAIVDVQTSDPATCTIQQIDPAGPPVSPFARDNSRDPDPKGPTIEDPLLNISYSRSHQVLVSYENITDEQEYNFTYRVVCRNLAGVTAQQNVDATVHLSSNILVLSPAKQFTATTVPVAIQPSFIPQQCTVMVAQVTQALTRSGTNFSRTLTMQDGRHQLFFNCTGSEEAILTYSFVIDSTPPVIEEIVADNFSCSGRIGVRVIADDPVPQGVTTAIPTGVALYNITATDGSWSVKNSNAEDNVTLRPRNVSAPITITGVVTDHFGNVGTAVSKTITVQAGDEEQCTGKAFITLLSTNQSSSGIFTIFTTLRASSCTYSSDNLQTGELESSDAKTHTVLLAAAKQTVTLSCKELLSTQQHQKSFLIGYEPGNECESDIQCPQGRLCLEGVCTAEEEPPECEDDTKCVQGTACLAGSCIDIGCSIDDDCAFDEVCTDKVCVVNACMNGMQDIDEDGIDCGGACESCDITPPLNPPPDDLDPILPPEEESNWLSIVLIILGAVIMAGAGYFLYEEAQYKSSPMKTMFDQYRSPMSQSPTNAQSRLQPLPPMQNDMMQSMQNDASRSDALRPMMPAMEAAYDQGREERQIKLDKAYQEMVKRRAEERKKITDAFQEKKESKEESKESEKKEYADVESIKPKKKPSAFDELEKIGKR